LGAPVAASLTILKLTTITGSTSAVVPIPIIDAPGEQGETTMAITKIQVYWPTEADPDDECWRYRLSLGNDVIDSGELMGSPLDVDDLDAAIEEVIEIAGLDITPDQFVRAANKESKDDFRYAVWVQPVEEGTGNG